MVTTTDKKQNEQLMPIRWMAPESIVDGRYSHKTDVWAFGIVLWEVFSFGATPYPKLGSVQVINFIISGNRLEVPSGCPSLYSAFMKQCWLTNPDARPDFTTIRAAFEKANEMRARGSIANELGAGDVLDFNGEPLVKSRISMGSVDGVGANQKVHEPKAKSAPGKSSIHSLKLQASTNPYEEQDASHRYASVMIRSVNTSNNNNKNNSNNIYESESSYINTASNVRVGVDYRDRASAVPQKDVVYGNTNMALDENQPKRVYEQAPDFAYSAYENTVFNPENADSNAVGAANTYVNTNSYGNNNVRNADTTTTAGSAAAAAAAAATTTKPSATTSTNMYDILGCDGDDSNSESETDEEEEEEGEENEADCGRESVTSTLVNCSVVNTVQLQVVVNSANCGTDSECEPPSDSGIDQISNVSGSQCCSSDSSASSDDACDSENTDSDNDSDDDSDSDSDGDEDNDNDIEAQPNQQTNQVSEAEDDGDDWISIKKTPTASSIAKAKAKQAKAKTSNTRCYWGIHCAANRECPYLHTAEEQRLFGKLPRERFMVWKSTPCTNQLKHNMASCSFSHGSENGDGMWCVHCRIWDHLTASCPKSKQ